MTGSSERAANVTCESMTAATRAEAARLLGRFLDDDAHYRASAAQYGDGGAQALARALDLFLARPELGFVWLARMADAIVGACVVCYAISTSRGGLVVKLDDVTVDANRLGEGIGGAMLDALVVRLAEQGVGRIDTACHRANAGAWRFYARHGFRPLDEERIALLI
ncbi:MAG TPA: GNAT family N-acetyltransferase [Casimicrobiaceae bacterium]|jgi:GNAT superfamily N-acetyltransferase|nr:GNAT family N-acetyltransferase [Casimicrobiaceae bacterium]